MTAGRSGWDWLTAHRLTAILGLWLAVAVIYWPSAVALDAIWRGASGDAYTHGHLVLLASRSLIARDRERLTATPLRPVGWVWVLVAMLSGAWLWAWRAAIQVLHVLLLLAILLTALVAALSWRIARRCVFPLALLLVAMPIRDPINQSLQTASAKMTGLLVWLSGMLVHLQSDLIQLPGGTIEIAQACAGLNGVVIGLTVAALYGEFVRDPLRRRLAWLALMGMLAMVANAVRIFILTAAAYNTDMRSPFVTHHIWLGWVLFAVAVTVFLAIAGRLANIWDRGSPPQAQEAPTADGHGGKAQRLPLRARIAGIAVALGSLGLLPALSYAMGLVRSGTPSDLLIQWPQAPRSWHGPMSDTASERSLCFVDPSAESLRRYLDARSELVEVFAVANHTQTQDAMFLGCRNDLLRSAKELQARSQGIADSAELTGFRAEAFLWLSGSLDLHQVDAGRIFVPTTAVGAREDQLVPLSDVRALAARMSTASQHEISLTHGHDAYLREVAPLRAILARALGSGS